MKCQKCGTEINAQDRFCPECGSKVEQEPVAVVPTNSSTPYDISNVWPEWQIEKQLGRGSYGVVYQAVRRDNNVESHAAIKIISIPSDSSEVDSLRSEGLDMDGTRTYFKGIVDDFVGEIQLMESLKGIQNIVSVEDYKVVEKTDTIGWDIYIRMELLTPFNTYICDKNLTEEQVIKLGTDICTALEICSQRNIIHRDIKPENIFVNDFGYFKLGDFGIARKLENMTGGLSQKGTYNYMAPEVVNNNKLPFLDSDKQILSPSERKNAVERRIRGEALPAPCNASAAMASLILRACAHNPASRFMSATEMKRALISVANGTYIVSATELDRTTNVRSAQDNYGTAAAVINTNDNAQQSNQPVVNTFGEAPKKKKGKKAKIIIISVLAGILALAIALTVMFFTSPAYKVYSEMKSEDFESALDEYGSEVEDNFIQEIILNMLLKNRAKDVVTEYKNGDIDYETAAEELNALDEMGFDGSIEKLDEIMALYANDTVSEYDKGKIGYDKAYEILNNLKNNGYEDADDLIANITASNNASNALEKADEYYENGDYENAISEYSKVPKKSESYEEAQSKLDEVYEDYIDSTASSASRLNSSGNYKEAIRKINTAYDILPDDVDTSELDDIKEESLASYKSEVANEVTELTEEAKWTEAFEAVDEAISFDDNDYFQDLKTSTEDKYVDSVTAAVQKYLDDEDYIGAKRVAENGLTVLPDNKELKELKKDVEDSTPTYLLDVCKPYASRGCNTYTNGETISMGGKSYTNAFVLGIANDARKECSASFNLESKYRCLG